MRANVEGFTPAKRHVRFCARPKLTAEHVLHEGDLEVPLQVLERVGTVEVLGKLLRLDAQARVDEGRCQTLDARHFAHLASRFDGRQYRSVRNVERS